jgi:hypothetical protein
MSRLRDDRGRIGSFYGFMGGSVGITTFEGTDFGEVPAALLAVTVKV